MPWRETLPPLIKQLVEAGYLQSSQPANCPRVEGLLTFDTAEIERGQKKDEYSAFLAGMMFSYLPWIRVDEHECTAAPLVSGQWKDERMRETARVGAMWLLNTWNPSRLALATAWPTRDMKLDPEVGLDLTSGKQVRVLYSNVFLFRLPNNDATSWRTALEMVGQALVQPKYRSNITLWANVRRVVDGDVGLCIHVTPYKDHYYTKLWKHVQEIPGCDRDEFGRRYGLPTEEARPVFGISKNQLSYYLSPVWWRGEVFGTIRAAWAATGDVPEEMDYLIKVPLTESASLFGNVTGQHSFFELVS